MGLACFLRMQGCTGGGQEQSHDCGMCGCTRVGLLLWEWPMSRQVEFEPMKPPVPHVFSTTGLVIYQEVTNGSVSHMMLRRFLYWSNADPSKDRENNKEKVSNKSTAISFYIES